MTFATKGVDSTFLSTYTLKPKLNQLVNTTLNQVVIQFEPLVEVGVFNKCFQNSDFFFIKHCLEELKENSQKLKRKYHGQDTCDINFIYFFLSKDVLSCCFEQSVSALKETKGNKNL